MLVNQSSKFFSEQLQLLVHLNISSSGVLSSSSSCSVVFLLIFHLHLPFALPAVSSLPSNRVYKRFECFRSADCLHVFLYKEYSECLKFPTKSTIPLEDFFGLQHGFLFDKESHVLAIICRNRVVNLAFHSQETLDCWRLTILQHLGEGKSPNKFQVLPLTGCCGRHMV